MKIKYIKPAILIFIVFVFSCKKTPEIPTGNKIKIGETTIDSIAYYTANVSTIIIVTDGNEVTEHGHCWSTNENPTIENEKTSLGKITQTTTVKSELTNLIANTQYYIRVYVIFNGNTVYLGENTIQTLTTRRPTVITNIVSNITINSATCGGTNDDGGLTISQRGVCWDSVENFTLQNSLGQTVDIYGTGSFISNITGLTEGVTYYAIAYATNEKGTSYGEVIQFSTLPITLPTVTTAEITEITNTSATSGGNVTSNSNGTVTARGMCWNATGNPTLKNNIGITTNGSGTGGFSSQIIGLTENTTYFLTAYATNEKGSAYGQIKSFLTRNDFIDPRDGQIYETVVIGSQSWFAENLNYNTADSWCYDNNVNNCNIYGRLYTWDAAVTACPDGWHLPSDEEWKILEGNTDTQYGVGDPEWNGTGYRGYDDGKRLKTSTDWSQNTGTNAVGFSALPGGYLSSGGGFSTFGLEGYWWSATANGSSDAWYRELTYGNDKAYRYYRNKASGFSVRCVKD